MVHFLAKTIFILVLFSFVESKAQQTLTIANQELKNCQKPRQIETPVGIEYCCADQGHAKECSASQILQGMHPSARTKVSLIGSTKKAKDPYLDFQIEFSNFCTDFLKQLNVQIQKPVSLSNQSTSIDLGALSKKQSLTAQTPCGIISSENQAKFDSQFPTAIRLFCTEMTKKHPSQAKFTNGIIEFGNIKSSAVVSANDSCVLGNVQLVGQHRLQNAVIIGLSTHAPLIIDTSENKSESITWSGIYFGSGKHTKDLKKKIENGSGTVTELKTYERLQFRTTDPVRLDELPNGIQQQNYGR